jgi:predicted ATPase
VTEPSRHFERVDWSARDEPPHSAPDLDEWPFTIPAVAQLVAEGGLELPAGVTFLVGENGSGKSTLVEALAAVYPGGGSSRRSSPRPGPTRASRTRHFAGT